MTVNMRNVILVLLVIMLGSFALAAMFGGVQFNFMGWDRIAYGEVNIDTEQTVEAEGITGISVTTVSVNVTVTPVDSDQIRVHLHGRVSENATPDFTVDQRGGLLNIRVEPQSKVITGQVRSRLVLDIYVPADYNGELRVGTVSGRLEVSGLDLTELNYSSVSGRLQSDNVTTAAAGVRTTSGDARLTGFTGNLDFRSVSGDLDVSYTEFDHDISAHTTSGRVMVRLPQESEFRLRATTVSGKIHTDFPVTVTSTVNKNNLDGVAGSDKNSIYARTVSGNVTISR